MTNSPEGSTPLPEHRLTVNGRRVTVRTEDDTPLLYVLRNQLGLKGSRFGCGLGVCGACYVLADGSPTYSCITPVTAVRNASVTTVEGLGSDGAPHPVARALQEEQAAQCGYCISGIVVNAAALLAANPRPTRAEVCAELDRNLCRCGVHDRVIRAVLSAADASRGDAK